MLDQSRDCTSSYFCRPKKFAVLPPGRIQPFKALGIDIKRTKNSTSPGKKSFVLWLFCFFFLLRYHFHDGRNPFILLHIFGLKVVSATFLLVCFVSLKESTCETRKNVFYFISKALFVLEIIKFSLF